MSSSGKVIRKNLFALTSGAPALPTTATVLPTIVVGAANAASTITNAVSIPAVITVNSVRVFNANKFAFYGGIPTIGVSFPDYTGISSNDGNVNNSSPLDAIGCAIEVYTDALSFDINVKDTSIIRVLADGAYIYGTDTTYGWKGAAAGNGYLHNITYTGARQLRRITIELDGPGRFFGLNVGPNDSVLPGLGSALTLVNFGDSFTEPTIADAGAYPNTMAQMGFPWRLGQLLGIRNVIASGSGGTGYLTPGPYSRQPFTARAANDIGKFKPDFCVMHAGLNDNTGITNGTYTQNQLQAAIESVMTQTWAVSPNTFFFLSLNWYSGNTPNAALTTAQQLAAAKYPGKCVYLSQVSGNTIYSGTGKVGGVTGAGNCDMVVGTDGTHPSFYGHTWLAYQLYAAIIEYLATVKTLGLV